jgi:hypothetical protein
LIPHIKYVAFVLFFVATSAVSESSASFDAWVPAGWKLILTAAGDLDRDGISDAVLVLEQTNPANLKPHEGLGTSVLNVNPRRLLILLKTSDGYRNILSRDDLLPSENSEVSPCLDDPLQEGGISVSSGKFIVELRAWLSCGSWGVTHRKFTFRLENNRFRLIGYDYREFSRSTGEGSEDSINYLTGKRRSVTGLNEFEDSKPKVLWSKISGKREFYLDDIVLDCYYSNNEPGCAWKR